MEQHYSSRVMNPLLIQRIEEFKKTGNLLALINELLLGYSEGGIDLNNISMEMVELRKIKEGFVEVKNKIKEYLGKIGELEAKFQNNIINSRTNEIKK
jgi:hypothetical protein